MDRTNIKKLLLKTYQLDMEGFEAIPQLGTVVNKEHSIMIGDYNYLQILSNLPFSENDVKEVASVINGVVGVNYIDPYKVHFGISKNPQFDQLIIMGQLRDGMEKIYQQKNIINQHAKMLEDLTEMAIESIKELEIVLKTTHPLLARS